MNKVLKIQTNVFKIELCHLYPVAAVLVLLAGLFTYNVFFAEGVAAVFGWIFYLIVLVAGIYFSCRGWTLIVESDKKKEPATKPATKPTKSEPKSEAASKPVQKPAETPKQNSGPKKVSAAAAQAQRKKTRLQNTPMNKVPIPDKPKPNAKETEANSDNYADALAKTKAMLKDADDGVDWDSILDDYNENVD